MKHDDIWLARQANWTPQSEDARDAGDTDYARIIHSASFRRLQGKTQILNLGDSDFYRTRLTHSLEVAQIAGGVAAHLAKNAHDHEAADFLPSRSLIQAIGCAHDLGHPPFGHGGEVALNYCMHHEGQPKQSGFEGNGQTLRILNKIESYSRDKGANLTRRTMLGLLKYPIAYSDACNATLVPHLKTGLNGKSFLDMKSCKPPKCYFDAEQEIVDWLLEPLTPADREAFCAKVEMPGKHAKTLHKSLDCMIMDVADDIAYGVHDLEDAIALGLVSEGEFRQYANEKAAASFLTKLSEQYPNGTNDVYETMVQKLFGTAQTRKHYINRLVHHFISAVEFTKHEQFEEPLLRYGVKIADGPRHFLDALQNLIAQVVIFSPNVQQLEFKGQGMVIDVFSAIKSDPLRLLPVDMKKRFEDADDGTRIICDFVASMTDSYLLKTYERLFAPRMGSVFDKL